MAKLTLSDFGGAYNSWQRLNSNNTLLEAALEKTLSRDGTAPNQMEAVLDMNDYRIINSPGAILNSDVPNLGQILELIAEITGGDIPVVTPDFIFTSAYDTFEEADIAASTLGWPLLINSEVILDSDYTTEGDNAFWFVGGWIDCNGNTLTFTDNTIVASPYEILKVQTTGSELRGNLRNEVLYPEWTGAIGGQGLPVINAATETRKAIQAWEDFDSQSLCPTRHLQFDNLNYVVDQPITNPVAGTALRWRGKGSDATLVYNSANTQVRILTGNISSSRKGVFQSQMQFLHLDAVGTTPAFELRDWCFFEHEYMVYDRATVGYYIRCYGPGGFSENCRGRSNVYGAELSTNGIRFNTASGTGSFRGFVEENFLFSRELTTSATVFLYNDIGPNFLYGGSLTGTVTNHQNQAMTVIANTSFGVFFKNVNLDLEVAGSGTIAIASGTNVYLGGSYTSTSSLSAVTLGSAWLGASVVLDGVRNNLMTGWSQIPSQTVTGAGVKTLSALVPTASYQATFKIDGGSVFTAYVDCIVYPDYVGTLHKVTPLSVQVLYNTTGDTFAGANIGVSSSAQVTFDIDLGATVATVSGTLKASGGYQ